MNWMSVHGLLVELAETVQARSTVPKSGAGWQAFLDELLVIDAETRPRIDAAIEVLVRGAHLPLLSGIEYFMLEQRVIHAMNIPVILDLRCSLLDRHIVPDLQECGVSPLQAIYWLLVDVWQVAAESNLQEFAQLAAGPSLRVPSDPAQLAAYSGEPSAPPSLCP